MPRNLKRVAHFRSTYLGLSETFIHAVVSGLSQAALRSRAVDAWAPVVFTGSWQNRNIFPVSDLQMLEGIVWPKGFLPRFRWRLSRSFFYRNVGVASAMELRLTDALVRAIRKWRPAVLHAHFGDDGIAAIDAVRETNCPFVTTFYGYDISADAVGIDMKDSYRKLFRTADRFLVEGPHMKQLAIDAGCPAERLIIQPIAIDVRAFPFRPPVPGKEINVLVAGRFVEKKGIKYAIRAFGIARRSVPNLKLWLVGDGPLRDEIDSEITELDLPGGSIRKFGFLKYDEYQKLAREADILLVSSVTAESGDSEGGAPTTILEMQAMGKPIVATRHADIPNVVPEGESAFLAEERDVDGLADALGRVAGSPDLWSSMAAAGRGFVERNHDIRTQVESLEAIYDDLASRGGGHREYSDEPLHLSSPATRAAETEESFRGLAPMGAYEVREELFDVDWVESLTGLEY